MVVGVTIGISIYRMKSAGQPCQQTWENLFFSFTVYFSYFLLFCNFFYQAYLTKNNRYEKITPKSAKNGEVVMNGKHSGSNKPTMNENVHKEKNNGTSTRDSPPMTRKRAALIH